MNESFSRRMVSRVMLSPSLSTADSLAHAAGQSGGCTAKLSRNSAVAWISSAPCSAINSKKRASFGRNPILVTPNYQRRLEHASGMQSANLAVLPAVQQIDQHPERQPDSQPDPGLKRQE